MTQKELADQIPGSAQGSDVSRWERGLHLPNSATREHIAKALEVSIGDLYAEAKVEKGPTPDVLTVLNGDGGGELSRERAVAELSTQIGELALVIQRLEADIQELLRRSGAQPGERRG